MDTLILGTSEEEILRAGEILANGGLVAFPTETVYGLGANALDPVAAKKIYEAKGRPSDNPMIVHIADLSELPKLTTKLTEDMKVLMAKFWPGPMTLVVPAKDIVPKVTTGGLDTVAIRFPSNEIARRLIKAAGVPIAAPSANLSGKPSPTCAEHVIDDMDGKIDAIILGDKCQVGIESTVIDMTGDVTILRPGIITKDMLEEALGKEVYIDEALLQKPDIFNNGGLLETSSDYHPKSPGMKYKHYAPNAEMVIYEGPKEKVIEAIANEKMKRASMGEKVEVIVYDDTESESLAHDFFAKLRACDKAGVDLILAAALTEDGVGFAVMNRMFKSAGYNIIKVE